MMGERQVDQAALFYEFSLERHFPATHLLWSIDRFVGRVRLGRYLAADAIAAASGRGSGCQQSRRRCGTSCSRMVRAK